MPKYLKPLASFMIITIYLSLSFQCNIFKKEPEIFRLIDHISKTHVIETPYKDLLSQFNLVEEDLSQGWSYIPELSNDARDVWAVSTTHLPLNNDRLKKPDEMTLQKDGKFIAYAGQIKKITEAWQWIGTNEHLDLTTHKDFKAKHRGVRLGEGESYSFHKLFPEGEITFDLRIINFNWEHYIPNLLVLIDGKTVQEITIIRKKSIRVRTDVKLGFHDVEIRYPHSLKNSAQKEFVILGQVRISNNSDIILFTRPALKPNLPPQGNFTLWYYSSEAIPEKEKPEIPASISNLYFFQNWNLIHDWGVSENPYSIKKKFRKGEYTLNYLIAPAPTKLAIPIMIPPQGVLEFGYGVHFESPRKNSDQVLRFQVTVEDSGMEHILWSDTFNTAKDKGRKKQKVDLSNYTGKKNKLTFLTEEINPNIQNLSSVLSFPFWENPLVYSSTPKQQPNIVLISIDTVRPDHLGCYGYTRRTSSNIDELSREGVLFSNTYSSTSWTLPAHISLLTSLNCAQHQVYYPFQRIRPQIPTLADVLKTNQYFTVAFTGGAYLSSSYGFARGFDSYHEISLGGNAANRYDEAERLAEITCDWLQNNREKSFFLFLHTYQPHDPYANLSPLGKTFLNENSKWKQINMDTILAKKGRYQTHFTEEEKQNIIDLYDGEIKYTDVSYIRPIIEKMKELGLYENSLIILTSDHGEEFFDHEAWLHDHSVYEEAIRIPLIIKFPHSQYKGQKVQQIVSIIDIMPTILDALNIKNSSLSIDGRSLFSLITEKETQDRSFAVDLAHRDYRDVCPTVIAMNQGSYKFIHNKKIKSPYIARVSKNFGDEQTELYDLKNDPRETKNIVLQIENRDLCFDLLNSIKEYCEKFSPEILNGERVTMDDSLRERLRALGYIR